jgi:hypothetical protein
MKKRSLLFLLSIAFSVTGCSGKKDSPADRVKRSNDLKEIGLKYHEFCKIKGKAPEKAEDLIFGEIDANAASQLKSGDIVFIYGVSSTELQNSEKGSGGTILAYEKDVPEKGGLVLYGDANVQSITADEFKKATLAKKK